MSNIIEKLMLKLTVPIIFLILSVEVCSMADAAVRKERIMVVIPEVQLRQTKVMEPAGETEIMRILIEVGYKVVDQEQINKIRYNDIFEKAWKGDDTGALKLARKFNADILIVGTATSEFIQNVQVPPMRGMPGGSLISCRATIQAKAFRSDTGQIIATCNAQASGVDLTETIASKVALAEAAKKAANYFIDMFDRKSPSVSGAGIELVVEGIRGFSLLNNLKTRLSRIPGVDNVEVLSFEGGTATIDVTFRGNAMDFASAIEANGIKMKINKLEATRIKAEYR